MKRTFSFFVGASLHATVATQTGAGLQFPHPFHILNTDFSTETKHGSAASHRDLPMTPFGPSPLCANGGLELRCHLRIPQASLWACTILLGFTHDGIQEVPACAVEGEVLQYHLRIPQDVVWACAVPPGRIYTAERDMPACATGGEAPGELRTRWRV